MSLIDTLAPLRAHGKARTTGLDDATVLDFAARDAQLGEAIEAAAAEYRRVRDEFPELLDQDEDAQRDSVQAGFVNFYSADNANPYVALTARGPWIVTLKGAVIYDTGGYGMLGLGHAPAAVLEAMARPQALANIMTPSVSQLRFANAMRREIGQTRGGCPYAAFLCLNSGSESVSLAARIVDANAKTLTDDGARHAGKAIKRVVVKGSFHGRTDKPALYSDSTRKTYVQYLASYRGESSVIAIPPYDADALRKAFADADANGWFIEAMFLEPVMGEGDPGRSVPVDFYNLARKADPRSRRTAAGRLDPGRPARHRHAVDRRLPRLRGPRRRTWRPIPRRSTPASSRCRCWPSTSAPPASTSAAPTATP